MIGVVTSSGVGANGVASKVLPRRRAWVRNPSWLPLPSISASDEKVVGLYRINEFANFAAMNVTCSGGYTVDWGDGSAPQNYTSATQANYEYTWSDLGLSGTNAAVTFTDSGDTVNRTAHGYTDGMTVSFATIVATTGIVTDQIYYVIVATANTFQVAATSGGSALALTTDGSGTLLTYKQAVVVVTATNGTSPITSCLLNTKHSQAGLNAYATGWLDLTIAGSAATLGLGGTQAVQRYLQRFSLLSSAITTYASLFSNCSGLVIVEELNSSGTVMGAGSMFASCSSLTTIPAFNMSSVTGATGAFFGCASLTSIPLFNTASLTNAAQMFSGCASLTSVPLFNTASVTTMLSMFLGCVSLTSVPLFNTASVISASGAFSGCTSLTSVPPFNTPVLATTTNMFLNCTSLTTVPLFNTASLLNASSMFSGCTSLTSVPLFNMASVTSASNMFFNCASLTAIPLFNTPALVLTTGMFNGCVSLISVPLFNTAGVLDMTNMFSSCRSLVSIPALSVAGTLSSASYSQLFDGNPSLCKVEMAPKFTFSAANCKLSGPQLDALYTLLPTVVGQTITVTGNYGTTTDTPSIATGKGWVVVGS